MELLTNHPGRRHGDVETLGIDLPSGRVLGLTSESPRIRFLDGDDFGSSSWKIITAPTKLGQLCFYRRRGGPRRVPPAGPGGTVARAAPGPWVASWVTLWFVASSWCIKIPRKFACNSENISRRGFSEIESIKNRELALASFQ